MLALGLAALAAVLAASTRSALSRNAAQAQDFLLLLPLVIAPSVPLNPRCAPCWLYATVIGTLAALPFLAIAARIVFGRIHRDQMDAARLLGLGEWAIICKFVIPNGWVTLAIGAVFALVRVLQMTSPVFYGAKQNAGLLAGTTGLSPAATVIAVVSVLILPLLARRLENLTNPERGT